MSQKNLVRVNGKEVYLIHEPMAAIGISIYYATKGNMIVDIGGGTTEIAVIALANCLRQISKNCW
jgi:rod shape-determining protein MreB